MKYFCEDKDDYFIIGAGSYFRDFSKYPPSSMVPKIVGIWDSIVSQLSRENRKFKYSEINKGARAREYENIKHFKIYMPDVGLLRKMSDYPVSSLIDIVHGENIPFKGAVAENYVLQELNATFKKSVYYWFRNNYEMDFVIQLNDKVLPLEVKAGLNVKSKSMKKILEDVDMGVRISMRNLSSDGKILNVPLVLVSELERLCGLL